jgi:long-chain-acyl-CoA dehydrogenase
MLKIVRNTLKTQKCFYSSRPETSQMDTLMDIGARKILNEDHDIMRESVRKFYKSVDRSRVNKWEEQGENF